MIIDSSALLAILYQETDADVFARAIAGAPQRLMSAANYLETAIVIDRQRGLAAGRQFDRLVVSAEIEVEPVTQIHADIARQAYLEFGKGKHAAALNFGACFSYALARSLELPLLFKGEDFSRTDIRPAIAS